MRLPNFYPRSPRGERRGVFLSACNYSRFLSTLPARGATWGGRPPLAGNIISIHAPREGSDIPGVINRPSRHKNFYPRSPRGERPVVDNSPVNLDRLFLSTLPARGATLLRILPAVILAISIHAPREGSDAVSRSALRTRLRFLSTLPARGATRPSGRSKP